MLVTNEEKNLSDNEQYFDEQLLTPAEIVQELDRYIIAQEDAKKAVAIALRNRWRRLRVPTEIRDEITPKNIIMIGPTGVGKTEISRRLARLSKAPFVKVEASKFTEVGYVGRDVDSIVRDLVEAAHSLVREEERKKVFEKAEKMAEEQLLDLLLPGSRSEGESSRRDDSSLQEPRVFLQDQDGVGYEEVLDVAEDRSHHDTREKLRSLLHDGKLEDRVVEVEITKQFSTQMQILGPQGFGEIEGQIKDMFSNLMPKQREVRKLPVSDARQMLIQESQDGLIDEEQISKLAIQRAEQTGIVFIDEIDKICGGSSGKGPDVSREGVQRDLLPETKVWNR
jgi:ATP-dependent HslUV protease ATP-binding subunit HslU